MFITEMFGKRPSKTKISEAHRDDAYTRDLKASQTGFDGSDKRAFKRAELQHELGHETNNIAIAINGKTWKVIPGKGYADSREERAYLEGMRRWAEKKSASSGKKWTVHLTGAPVSEAANPAQQAAIAIAKKKEQGVAEAKDTINFSPEDLKRLERIRDLPTLKAQALALISKPSDRPMKPEKVEWFKGALERMTNPMAVIKLMYDLLLSGEGHKVVGSKNSMASNTYRQRFGEDDSNTRGGSKFGAEVQDLLKQGAKIDSYILGARGHITRADGSGLYMKRLNKPYSKMSFVLPIGANRDADLYLKQIGDNHYHIKSKKDDAWLNSESKVSESDVDKYMMEMRHAGYLSK